MRSLGLLVGLCLAGCDTTEVRHLETLDLGANHRSMDSGFEVDAGTDLDTGQRADAGNPADVGVISNPGLPQTPCGPNQCWTGETCCDARCGICALPGECFAFACPEP